MDNQLPSRSSETSRWARLAITCLSAWLQERTLRLKAEERIDMLESKTLSQTRQLRKLRSDQEILRARNLALLRQGYGYLGLLADAFYSSNSPVADVYQTVVILLREVESGPKGPKRLIKCLDKHLDCPVATLKNQFPELKADDIAVYVYSVIDYKPARIILLTGCDDVKKIYARKERLIGRINKLGPKRSQQHLDYLK